MTFSAARVAYGTTQRRALEFGAATPVMESFSHVGGSSGTSIILTKPTSTVENDVLVCAIGHDGSTTVTPPSDAVPWVTAIAHGSVPNGAQSSVWFQKVAGASEPADYTFTLGASESFGAVMWRISGADLVTPIAAGATSTLRANGGTGDNLVCPGIILTRTNVLLLIHANHDNNFATGTLFPPTEDPDFVEDISDLHGGDTGTRHGGGHEPWPTGGGTGIRNWHISDNFPHLEERCGHILGVQPPTTTPSFLELEGSSDVLLLEDGAGNLVLEN